MPLTSRRKRPLERAAGRLRDATLFIVAAEGARTEKNYFEFKCFQSTRVQVKVLPAGENEPSSPEYVLQRLRKFQEDFQLAAGDELWLVIDVDRWGDAKLSQVCREAAQGGYDIAVSNPCFEVWLALHQVEGEVLPNPASCEQISDILSATVPGGYKKTNPRNPKSDQFPIELANVAIERARALDVNPDERWPATTGTRVYRLVEKLKTFLDSPVNG